MPTRKAKLTAADFPQDKLSVAIFGPGVGEGIVVRTPENHLLLFDGVRDKNDPMGRVVDELVAAGCHIAFACLTHPHLDHYRGLGDTVARHHAGMRQHHLSANTELVVATTGLDSRNGPALSEVARAYAKARKRRELPDAEDYESLARVFHAFTAVNSEKPPWGDWQLVTVANGVQHRFGGVELHYAAPRSGDVMDAMNEYLASIKTAIGPRGKLTVPNAVKSAAFDPNVMSIAVALVWGNTRVLLTGDLVCESARYAGWSKARVPNGPYALVSVAHHASEGAHEQDVWDTVTGATPGVAVVTPFHNASGPNPPRPTDIERLLKLKWDTYLTSRPDWPGQNHPVVPDGDDPKERRPERNAGASGAGVYEDHGDDSAFLAVLGSAGVVESITLTARARRYVRR